MNRMYSIATALILVLCYILSMACALPFGMMVDSSEDMESVDNQSKACQLCLLYDLAEACEICTGDEMDSIDKRNAIRTPLFHPLFRGGYLKADSYKRYYTPLLEDEFPKKALNQYQPVYHPFLRGGFKGYQPPVNFGK